MHILLTNDDGIATEGITVLRQELTKIAQVTVIAPERERSASGHGITVHKPLRVKTYNYHDGTVGWSVSGTPADCVKIAIDALLKKNKPDLVVSGINFGANLGTDVLYSGTVSAAIEASILGCPSIAVSLVTSDDCCFSVAAEFTSHLCSILFERKLPSDILLNVNMPDRKKENIQGVEITKLGNHRYDNTVHKREDPRGKVYYWLAGEIVESDQEEGTDVAAIKAGRISITPIHFDLTNYQIIDRLKSMKINLP
jgi:5'-nucleotidase